MAFTARVPGNTVRAADITELQDALSGTSGAGQPIAMTALSDSSNYALDVRNLDTTNSYGLRVRDSGSLNLLLAQLAGCTLGKTTTLNGWGATAITTDLKLVNASITWNGSGVTFTALKLNVTNTASAADSLLLDLQVGGTAKFSVRKDGGVLAATIGPSLTQQHTLPAVTSDTIVTLAATQTLTAKTLTSPTINSATLSTPNVTNILYVNDSANTNMTTGVTINQAGADNEILCLKTSDITGGGHGFTDITEADTFGEMHKSHATNGGVALIGYGIANASLVLAGRGNSDATAKSTSTAAYIFLTAQKLSGATVGDCGADANLVVIRNNATTRFIFDAEGSAHADVEWTTFADDYDDVAMLTTLQAAMMANRRDSLKAELAGFLKYNRSDLERLNIARFDDANPGHTMLNTTRLSWLMLGAIRQLGARLERQEQLLLGATNG